MIWQPEFTDKTLSRKPGAVQFALFVQFSEFAFCWLYLMCITFCVLFFCEKKVRKNAFRRSFML
ncbi:hypothetical protein BMT70_26025 [Escherichia coli]|nr:hypothetical protein BMT70_26025 [Escherichia coli]